MHIELNCPHCNQQLLIDHGFAGKQAQCPSCQNILVVPYLSQPQNTTHTSHHTRGVVPGPSPLASWSLGLGIAGLLLFGPLTGIPAIICGHKARSRIRNSSGITTGSGLALAGLITGYIATVLGIIILPLMAFIIGGSSVAPFIYTLF